MAKANLEKPLVVRDKETLSISVNFDPKVCKNEVISNNIIQLFFFMSCLIACSIAA